MIIYSEIASASFGSFCVSATRYRGAENVSVVAIVVSEFEFDDVQRQIFAAHLVEASHYAALQKRPESVNGLGVNYTINVLAIGVPNGPVLFQFPVYGVFVSRNQADFFRDGFTNEVVQSFRVRMIDNASHNVALALDRTNHGFFAFATGSFCALVPMAIAVLAADIGFVDFDDAHELAEVRVSKSGADTMAHIVRRRIGTKTHRAVNLQSRNSLLAGQHQIDDLEPRFERNVRVFEDGSDKHRKAVGRALAAIHALPFERHRLKFKNFLAAATWTAHTFWPAARDQIALARIVIREQFFKLRDRHLLGEFDAHLGSFHA
jgi:hypothetical protein